MEKWPLYEEKQEDKILEENEDKAQIVNELEKWPLYEEKQEDKILEEKFEEVKILIKFLAAKEEELDNKILNAVNKISEKGDEKEKKKKEEEEKRNKKKKRDKDNEKKWLQDMEDMLMG